VRISGQRSEFDPGLLQWSGVDVEVTAWARHGARSLFVGVGSSHVGTSGERSDLAPRLVDTSVRTKRNADSRQSNTTYDLHLVY
jgi:hypothetical protein